MTKEEKLRKYNEWIFKCSAYQMALGIIGIDKQTVAPEGGTEFRDERSAYLSGELFSIVTDPAIFDILNELKDDEELDEETHRALQLYYKYVRDMICIPKDEFVAFSKLSAESYTAWLKAKKENNYSVFEPYLKQLIEAKKKQYSYRNSDMDLYDQMLDDFEPGMDRKTYDAFFDVLRRDLVPLIHKIREGKQIDNSFLYKEYPVEKQKAFMDHLLAYLHFDKSWGYQNETEHPFTSWTCENDCRTTTKYLPNNVISAILSTVHEVGHAYYEHDCDPKYDGMILSEGISCGMHESQSRLCENYLGRTLSFWKYNYPYLQETFPEQLKDVSLEDFYRGINVAKCTLIRTEADELTYPLHIMVRYEIERGLFDGSISTEGLDKTWDELYEKYLGIKAEKVSDGILQDVHWASGDFGYFPTYALGSAFAAQFVETMRKDINVDTLLEEGRYDEIMTWLKEHIHRYGCLYDAKDIIVRATGKPFDPTVYTNYLKKKYTELYGLDE